MREAHENSGESRHTDYLVEKQEDLFITYEENVAFCSFVKRGMSGYDATGLTEGLMK